MPKSKIKTDRRPKYSTCAATKGGVMDTMETIIESWENEHSSDDSLWGCRVGILPRVSLGRGNKTKSKLKLKRQKSATSKKKRKAMLTIEELYERWANDRVSAQTWQCRAQFLAFICRTQEENESVAMYLESLKKLACEGGVEDKKHVFHQFCMGTRDNSFLDKLDSMQVLPNFALKNLELLCFHEDGNSTPQNHCAFDMIFEKNVIHIHEKIFLSLDIKSFKNCLRVCKQWNQLLTSEDFLRKACHGFSVGIWTGQESLKTIDINKKLPNSNGMVDLWTI